MEGSEEEFSNLGMGAIGSLIFMFCLAFAFTSIGATNLLVPPQGFASTPRKIKTTPCLIVVALAETEQNLPHFHFSRSNVVLILVAGFYNVVTSFCKMNAVSSI